MAGINLANAYVELSLDDKGLAGKAAKSGAVAGGAYGKAMERSIRSALDNLNLSVRVDADTSAALAKISAIRGSSVEVKADVDTAAATAKIAALDAKTVDIKGKVDLDTGGFLAKMALLNAASRSAGGGMGFAATSALLLSPALIGVAAGAGAAAVALSGVVLGAAALGGALAAGAGVAYAAMKPVKESVGLYDDLQKAVETYGKGSDQAIAAQKRLNSALADMTPAGRAAHKTITTGLRPALGGLGRAAQEAALPGISKGLASLVPVINRFKPLVSDLGQRFGSMAEQAGRSLNGPFWKQFQAFLTGSLPGWFSTASTVVGNFARGFAALFMDLAPTTDDFVGSIERFSAKFREWAGSGSPGAGFERFMNSAREILPQVVVFIRTLWGAFKNVTVALAPLAPLMLGLVASFASFIGGMDPAHVRGFAIAIGVWLGVMKLARATIVLITVATKAWMVAQRLLNIVMRANPIGILITALLALGAGLVLLYKKNESFRKLVKKVWATIKTAIKGVVDWFKNTAWPAMKKVFDWIGDKATWLYRNAIRPSWNGIKRVVSAVVNWFRDTAWPTVKKVLGWFATGYKNLYRKGVKPAFDWIKDKIKSVYTWFRDTAWPTVKKVLGWFADGYINLYRKGVKRPFDWIKDKIKSVFDWFRDNGLVAVRRTLDKVKDAFEVAKDGIGKIWDKLRGLVKKPINVVIGFANTLIGGANRLIPGAGPLKKIPKLASGGTIPGPWRGPKADNVLGVSDAGMPVARVNPGEYITNVASTRRMEKNHPGALEHINRTGSLPFYRTGGKVGTYFGEAPGFAGGGIVGANRGRLSLKNELIALGRALQARGVSVGQHSAFGGNPRLGRAGQSYGSLHGWDLALDLNGPGEYNGQFDRLARSLWNQGWGVQWRSPGHYDHMHVDTGLLGRIRSNGWTTNPNAGKLGPGSGSAGGFGFGFDIKSMIGDWTKKVGSSWPAQMAIGIGSKMFNGIKDTAMKALSSLAPGNMADNAVGAGTKWANQQIVQRIAAKHGWHTGRQWRELSWLVNKESSWNNTAQNPTSSAYGLFQFLNSTWRDYGPKTSNPAKQTEYGLRYIKNRYGTPAGATAFHRANNWYGDGGQVKPLLFDQGGYLPTGTSVVHNATGRPEPLQRMDTAAGGVTADEIAAVMSGMQVVMDGRVVGDLVSARQAEQQRIRGRGYVRSGRVMA